MFYKKIAEYYDEMYKDRDYDKEVAYINNMFRKQSLERHGKVLDIGCGTGTLSFKLGNDYDVVGIDPSEDMIRKALEKPPKKNVSFKCCELNKFQEKDFEYAIATFNVINHMNILDELINFFNDVWSKLKTNGVFIFDCWNGVAIIREPPKTDSKIFYLKDKELHSYTTVKNIALQSRSDIIKRFDVVKDNKIEETFNVSYTHTAWTIKILGDLLKICNFDVKYITKLYEDIPATPKDWRITFVCIKNEDSGKLLYHPCDIIDNSVDLAVFTRMIEERKPFSYFRYGDGEFIALLNLNPGKSNIDRHEYFTDMGEKLKEVIIEAPFKDNLYFGLHGTWHQSVIQKFVVSNGLMRKRHWVVNLIHYFAIAKLQLMPFIEEIRKYDGDVVLVTHKGAEKMATILKAKHVIIPFINAWSETERVLKECEEFIKKDKPTIYLFSASMASEPWMYALYKKNPNNFYIDLGTLWDGMLGISNRKCYTEKEIAEIIEIIMGELNSYV